MPAVQGEQPTPSALGLEKTEKGLPRQYSDVGLEFVTHRFSRASIAFAHCVSFQIMGNWVKEMERFHEVRLAIRPDSLVKGH